MRRTTFVLLLLIVGGIVGLRCPRPEPVDHVTIDLPGLEHPVRVTTDDQGVPHVFGRRLVDVMRVRGYLHARDRFFQMDTVRRRASGTLAELTGNFFDLPVDALARVAGIPAAAEREALLLGARERGLLQAYADGVNAWLGSHPLPAEYAEVEISSVRPWEILDTLMMGKGGNALFNILLDGKISDLFFQSSLDSYEAAGAANGFDGRTLLLEDVLRFAPIAPAATVPDAGGEPPFVASTAPPASRDRAAVASASGRPRLAPERLAALATRSRLSPHARGSNFWGVASWASASGAPLVASDPHEEIGVPSPYYEIHLVVEGDPAFGNLDVSGMDGPGGPPGLFFGQSRHLAWGLTAFYSDVADVFRDHLVRGHASCSARLCIESAGTFHPVEERSETYRLNVMNGVFDDSVDATAAVRFFDPGAVEVLSVPFRSFGPILEVDDRSVVGPDTSPAETGVLTLQYTGLHGGSKTEAQLRMLMARDVFEFGEALRSFLDTVKHWVVADTSGNLAYFTSGEIPLRADLEAGQVVGEGPWFVRDGSGPNNWIPDPDRSQGQAIPFRVLPFEEMPRVLNPPSGFLVNANNDPTGLQLDNDLLNQFRPSSPGSIYYLGFSLVPGLRAGRVTQLLREKLDAGEKVTIEDMKRFQANTQQLDAEILTPFLLAAWENAMRPGAPDELAAYSSDPALSEAIGRLTAWDFSTPTGIPEGYDASDVDGVRNPEVSADEAAKSVAATLYNVWRAELIENVVTARLDEFGLPGFQTSSLKAIHQLLSRDPFTVVGASGVDFFPEPAALPAADRRDVALLQALRDTLDLLAGSAFADAFANSTDQDDYRWGKLNRIRYPHPLGGARSIPPATGFEDLDPLLPGLARDGGYNTVNQATLMTRANAVGEFVPQSPPAHRLVMAPGHPRVGPVAVLGFSSLAGGSSGDALSPLYASRLAAHLTVDYHRVRTNPGDIRHVATKVEHFAAPQP